MPFDNMNLYGGCARSLAVILSPGPGHNARVPRDVQYLVAGEEQKENDIPLPLLSTNVCRSVVPVH